MVLKCLLILLLAIADYNCTVIPFESETNQVDIYLCPWTYAENIIRLSLNGTHVEEHQLTPASTALGIAYDPVEGELYWSEYNTASIKKTNMDGTVVNTVSSSLLASYPYGLAIDSVSRKLFYTGENNHVIVSMDLSGGNAQVILDSSDVTYPTALALDEQKRKIFWGIWGNGIFASGYDGSNKVTVASTKGVTYGLTLDTENEVIYWCGYFLDGSEGWIESVSYDGSNRRELYSGTIKFYDIFFLYNTLYLTATNDRVYSRPVDSQELLEITSSWDFSYARLYVISKTEQEKKPKIESRLVHSDELHSELVFLCTFSQHSEDVFYSTRWFVEDKLVLSSDPEKWSNGSVIENHVLTEAHLRESDIRAYGIQMSCSVEATYEEGNISTPAVMSRKKYVGIQNNLKGVYSLSKYGDGLFDFVIVLQLHAGENFDWLYDYNALELNALLLNGSLYTIGNKGIFNTMGLKPAVSTTSVSVYQGASTSIKLSLTDPFGCGTQTHTEECKLRIKVHTLDNADKCGQAVLMPAECGASIIASRWDEPVSISLVGMVTSTYGSSSKRLNLKLTSPFMRKHQMWGEAELSKIQVRMSKDTSSIRWKTCYSTCDPRMKTFDGRRYQHQYKGVFTLYKHTELPLEVQIQTYRCSSSATCNCGVAVRAGRTVFEINRCPQQSGSWFLDFTLCEDGGDVLQVKRRGSYYDIYLPTGAKISIALRVSTPTLNVYMYPSVQDMGKSRGLCGNMSEYRTCNDDFVLRNGSYSTDPTTTEDCSAGYKSYNIPLAEFSNSWRVEEGGNLFDHSDLSSLTSWPQQRTFCSCSEDRELNDPLQEVECSAGKAHETCKSLPGYSDVIPSQCSINRRRRRSAAHTAKSTSFKRTKRNTDTWPEGWTEESATAHCQQLFEKSRTVQVCGNITGVDTNSSIDICIQDIKLSGTTMFGELSVDTVRNKCYHEVLVNPELQSNETSPGNTSVYDIVVAEACPNDCSGHGNCSEGECLCVRNFGGVDCSVDLSTPPVLASIQGEGHCDMASLSCDVISVYGDTFTEERTTCQVYAFKVTETGLESEGSSESAAIIRSISEARCTISAVREETETDYVRAYRISVSNDGAVYSNNVSLLVYDGTCVTGHVDGTDVSWTKEPSYCLYGGRCFGNGTSRTEDECKMCMSDGSTAQWVNNKAPNCTTVDKDDNTILIIAGVAGALAVAVVVVVVAIIIVVLKNRKSETPKMDDVGMSNIR